MKSRIDILTLSYSHASVGAEFETLSRTARLLGEYLTAFPGFSRVADGWRGHCERQYLLAICCTLRDLRGIC